MFADKEHPVDGQLLTSKAQGPRDALIHRHAESGGDFHAHIVVEHLVQVDGGNLRARWQEPIIGGERTQPFADHHIGVGPLSVNRNDGGDLLHEAARAASSAFR